MDKNKVVAEFYQSDWFNQALNKMEPECLRNDLKQEVFLVLLEMPDERFFELHEQGFLKFFAIRTMLNMIKSDRSNFFKMFRNLVDMPIKEVAEVDYEEPKDVCLDCAFQNSRDQLYERDMFYHYTYTFDRNALALSRGTQIPYKTVTRTLQNAKQRIKCYLQSQQQ